ncbi:MAG: NUDIX domain-containing protein [Anaerolineales bacterium]
MPLSDQNIQPGRYSVIPRTLCFLLRDEQLLLLRIAADRGAWSGMLNGIGGHVRRGEDPLTSAKREIREETGLEPLILRLCGVVIVDVKEETGIGLYVFVGESPSTKIRPSPEGQPLWVPLKSLRDLDLVEDLPTIIPRALDCYRSRETFSAVYRYDDDGNLSIDLFP